MSMFTQRLIDGYALNVTDGYSVKTDWVDIHSSPFFSVSVLFASGNPNGTVTLEMSNDQSSDEVSRGANTYSPVALGVGIGGRAYPVTAGGLQGDPFDLNTIVGSSITVTSTGVNTYNTEVAGYRWVRVKYTAFVNANTTITVGMHRKAQISRVG